MKRLSRWCKEHPWYVAFVYTFYPYFRTLFLTFGLAVSRFSMSFSASICIAYVKLHKQRRMKNLSIDIPQRSRLSFSRTFTMIYHWSRFHLWFHWLCTCLDCDESCRAFFFHILPFFFLFLFSCNIWLSLQWVVHSCTVYGPTNSTFQ